MGCWLVLIGASDVVVGMCHTPAVDNNAATVATMQHSDKQKIAIL